MSYSILKASADKEVLKAVVRKEQYAPAGTKEEICEVIDAVKQDAGQIIVVDASGHHSYGTTGGYGENRFKVQRVEVEVAQAAPVSA